MEIGKSLFVEIGDGLRVPIGFRFRPTDEELLVHYLKNKICSLPLAASVIPEHQVFDTNPWDIPGDMNEKGYFFSKKSDNVKSCRRIVQAGSGYWKNIGPDKQVFSSLCQNHHQTVGIKRTSLFIERKRLQRTKTRWIMHQLFLVNSVASLPSTKNMIARTGDWVVCHIYQQKKRRARKMGDKKQESKRQRMIEQNMRRLVTNFNDVYSKMIIGEDNYKNNSCSHAQEVSSPSCSSGVSDDTDIVTVHDFEVVDQDQEATSYGSYDSSF